jgi:hypothetical protein
MQTSEVDFDGLVAFLVAPPEYPTMHIEERKNFEYTHRLTVGEIYAVTDPNENSLLGLIIVSSKNSFDVFGDQIINLKMGIYYPIRCLVID